MWSKRFERIFYVNFDLKSGGNKSHITRANPITCNLSARWQASAKRQLLKCILDLQKIVGNKYRILQVGVRFVYTLSLLESVEVL